MKFELARGSRRHAGGVPEWREMLVEAAAEATRRYMEKYLEGAS